MEVIIWYTYWNVGKPMCTPESSLLLLCLVQVVSATLGFLLSNQSLLPEQLKDQHLCYHDRRIGIWRTKLWPSTCLRWTFQSFNQCLQLASLHWIEPVLKVTQFEVKYWQIVIPNRLPCISLVAELLATHSMKVFPRNFWINYMYNVPYGNVFDIAWTCTFCLCSS